MSWQLVTPGRAEFAWVVKADSPYATLADLVTAFVSANGRAGRSLGFVPVRARNRDFAAVIDRNSGAIVGYLMIDPW